MRTEIWRTAIYDDVVYEGLYQVSNLGRVKNLNYRNTGKERLVKTSKDKDGYLKVNLRKNGEYKTCKVHRLVAQTFLPNTEGKPEINHKIEGDEGKTLNMVIFNKDGTIDKEKALSNGLLEKKTTTMELETKEYLKKQQTVNYQNEYFNYH